MKKRDITNLRDWQLSLDELIERAGWFKGSMEDWRRLSYKEQRELAFAGTGCEVAVATWNAPVICRHTGCMVRRGVVPKIAITNSILRAEASNGWLRFIPKQSVEGRRKLARIFRAYRAAARKTGVYDPWKIDYRTMVYAGVTQ
jgi:hypothetical protein